MSLKVFLYFFPSLRCRYCFFRRLAFRVRFTFHKWKSRVTIQEGEDQPGVGWEGVEQKGIILLIYSVIGKHGITIRRSEAKALSSERSLAKSIRSHEWKPLAIDDLG